MSGFMFVLPQHLKAPQKQEATAGEDLGERQMVTLIPEGGEHYAYGVENRNVDSHGYTERAAKKGEQVQVIKLGLGDKK